MSDAASILGLLAGTERLQVVAAIVLGAGSADDVSRVTGLDARTAAQALARLESGGVVVVEDRRYRVDHRALAQAARDARRSGPPRSGPEPAGSGNAHLRNFVRGERLISIPAAHGKRRAVLEWLAQRFEPGLVYPEREVNARLAEAHPDVAALRRYLVDDGLLDRRQGKYWRTGGAFEIDDQNGDA
jgi:DNA-binding transcriptional ArsR family regulator